MKQQKKNKFYTFLLSFVPGAAEMYMGFMRLGLSIMCLFVFSIMTVFFFNAEIFLFITAIIWCYGFFHARNLAACSEEIFNSLKDDFIWAGIAHGKNIEISNPVVRKWGAGILILTGLTLLWQNVERLLYVLIPDSWWSFTAPFVERLPQIIIAVLLIRIGIALIRGKKEEIDGDNK